MDYNNQRIVENISTDIQDMRHKIKKANKQIKESAGKYPTGRQSEDMAQWIESIGQQLDNYEVQMSQKCIRQSTPSNSHNKILNKVAKLQYRLQKLKTKLPKRNEGSNLREMGSLTSQRQQTVCEKRRMLSNDYSQPLHSTSLENLKNHYDKQSYQRSLIEQNPPVLSQNGDTRSQSNNSRNQYSHPFVGTQFTKQTKESLVLSSPSQSNIEFLQQRTPSILSTHKQKQSAQQFGTINLNKENQYFMSNNNMRQIPQSTKHTQDKQKLWEQTIQNRAQNIMSSPGAEMERRSCDVSHKQPKSLKRGLSEKENYYRQRCHQLKDKFKAHRQKYKKRFEEYDMYCIQLKQNLENAIGETLELKHILKEQNKNQPTDSKLKIFISDALGVDPKDEDLMINSTKSIFNDFSFHVKKVEEQKRIIDELSQNIEIMEENIQRWQNYANELCDDYNSKCQELEKMLSERDKKKHKSKSRHKKIQYEQKMQKAVNKYASFHPSGNPSPNSRTQVTVDEQRLQELQKKEKELDDREQKLIQQEFQHNQMLKKSVRDLDEQVKEHVKHSVEKERGEWQEKSLITSSELLKFQTMLEQIATKLDSQEQPNLKEARIELSLVKAQVKELFEFHKRLKEMSPIESGKKRKFMATSEKKNVQIIKLKGKDHQMIIDNSFDNLHELCNLQIEELKKNLKYSNEEKETLSQQLEDLRDKFQSLINDKMELEILYNQKLSEIGYYKKYLDEYERENFQIKAAFDENVKMFNQEKEEMIERISKEKYKKHQYKSRLVSIDSSGIGGRNSQLNQNQTTEQLKAEYEHLKLLNENQNTQIKILEGLVQIKHSGSQKDQEEETVANNHSTPYGRIRSETQLDPNIPKYKMRGQTSNKAKSKALAIKTDSDNKDLQNYQMFEKGLQLNEDSEKDLDKEENSNSLGAPLTLNSYQDQPAEQSIEDVRKIIRYEEYIAPQLSSVQIQGSSQQTSSPRYDHTAPQITSPGREEYLNTQYLNPQPPLTTTTRSQRILQKEQNIMSQPNKDLQGKTFKFDYPRSAATDSDEA